MVTAHFKNIRQNIIENLDNATDEIIVAVYWFTNHDLFNKLCEKIQDGIKVKLIIHNDFINNRDAGLNFQHFIDIGGLFYFSNPNNPMHNKFCVIDNKVLINGSYNWTYFAEMKNSENILIITNELQTISDFCKEFENLREELTVIDTINKLTRFEVDEFSQLSAREYLANDIIFEAKFTNRPELLKSAFQIAPNNIKIQQQAVALDLKQKRKLKHSIGASIIGDKFLKIVEKGASIPVIVTKIVSTTIDNQTSAGSTIYYGENEIASKNKSITKMTITGLPKKPAGEARMKYIFTIDIYGNLGMVKYSLDTGKSVKANENLSYLLEQE